MDNVSIVVESLDNAISFFEEIGLNLEGRANVEGEWAGRVTGLGSQCVEIAMMVTPDGHSRIELSRFLTLYYSESPNSSCKRPRLSTRHVHCRGY